jgi:hypothetical protein
MVAATSAFAEEKKKVAPPVNTHERATNRYSQYTLGLLLIRRAVAAGPTQQVT